MHHRLRATAVAIALLSLLPAGALAWEPPAHWSAVGAVADWEALDGRFYRLSSDPMFLSRSQDGVDQRGAYARTLVHDALLAAVTLDTWSTLPEAERRERSRLAGRQLDLATGLDPTNPYAWHLYGWFAACVGDVDRAGPALAGAEQALARVPEGELLVVRRGMALDRAWLARERGDAWSAAALVEQAAALGADDFQVTLLRGLLAARRGDHAAAVAESEKLRQVDIRRFPLNRRTTGTAPEVNNTAVWKAVPSDFAQRWIEALSFIEAGHLDMAAKAFGSYGLDHLYPQAHRFWDDAGLIYEVTGRREAASGACRTGPVRDAGPLSGPGLAAQGRGVRSQDGHERAVVHGRT